MQPTFEPETCNNSKRDILEHFKRRMIREELTEVG